MTATAAEADQQAEGDEQQTDQLTDVERLGGLFRDEFGDRVQIHVKWDQLTVEVDVGTYVEVARFCRDDERVDCDFFDSLFGIDERDQGFAIVANLYSTTHRHRVLIRHLCEGGRESPVAPSLTDLYRGANWHEREAWDMFGIEFDGHPGLAPRILTTENFEGWPLRKDFYLATREAKPWPGIKEPLELDDEGNPVERVRGQQPGEAPGPMALDEAMAEQAKRAAGTLDQEAAEIEPGAPEEDGGEDEDRTEAEEGPPEAPDVPEAKSETETELAAPQTGAPDSEAVQARPEEEASARAERARRKAAELRRQKRQQGRVSGQERREKEAAEAEAATETDAASTVSRETDEAVSAAAEGQGGPPGVPAEPGTDQAQGTTPREGEPTTHDKDTLGGVVPDSEPAQEADEPAPGVEAGEPPDAQAPGEAPVEGGLRETIDEEADAAPGPAGGQRPDSASDADEETAPSEEPDQAPATEPAEHADATEDAATPADAADAQPETDERDTDQPDTDEPDQESHQTQSVIGDAIRHARERTDSPEREGDDDE